MGRTFDDTSDEAEQISRAAAGDADAFTWLYQRYERRIYSYIYRLMADADDTTDLTQDTFVKAWRALPRLPQADANFGAWIHRIASNACLDVLRRRQRLRMLPWDGPKHDQMLVSTPMDAPDQLAIRQEIRYLVNRVLAHMSQRHRKALLLREYEGLSCYEIAQVMGLTRSAVKSMLFRAREEFRRVFDRLEAADLRAMETRREALTTPTAIIQPFKTREFQARPIIAEALYAD